MLQIISIIFYLNILKCKLLIMSIKQDVYEGLVQVLKYAFIQYNFNVQILHKTNICDDIISPSLTAMFSNIVRLP